MSDWTTLHLSRTPFSRTGRSLGMRTGATGRSAETAQAAPQPEDFGNRGFDGLPSNAASGNHPGLPWFGLAAKLGLSLVLTAGLAAGVNLHTGMTLSSPNLVRTFECMFVWSFALVSCMKSRHS